MPFPWAAGFLAAAQVATKPPIANPLLPPYGGSGGRTGETTMSLAASFAVPRHADRRWWVLAVLVAAQFMFVVDAFIVNVAIPSIRADL